jgi:type II secretory pathway pseudopilin PulG
MKQTIILLTTVILGIAISAMILNFKDTTKTITEATQTKMATQLILD